MSTLSCVLKRSEREQNTLYSTVYSTRTCTSTISKDSAVFNPRSQSSCHFFQKLVASERYSKAMNMKIAIALFVTASRSRINKYSSQTNHMLMTMVTTKAAEPRRSLRLRALTESNGGGDSTVVNTNSEPPAETKSRKRAPKVVNGKSKSKNPKNNSISASNSKELSKEQITALGPTPVEESDSNNDRAFCLPRTLECKLRSSDSTFHTVLGIDEAGRGPLAGPVVAAAVMLPDLGSEHDIPGIVDSKKITSESDREALYEKIIAMPNIIWAVSIINSAKIDEVNILQATLLGMRLAASVVINPNDADVCLHEESNAAHSECYVVFGGRCLGQALEFKKFEGLDPKHCYALIDGNKVPKEMPCEAESVVKGDGKEYIIAVASVLAKVTRDRLMHQYHSLYPQYNLAQHKGYPTSAHMAAVRKFGASPIHRRSFAPLKHMQFDKDGGIVTQDDENIE